MIKLTKIKLPRIVKKTYQVKDLLFREAVLSEFSHPALDLQGLATVQIREGQEDLGDLVS